MASDVDMLFRGLSEQDVAAFWSQGETVAFKADEVVLSAGRSEWDMYVVQEGEVSLWVGNVRLADLKVGASLGASALLIPEIQRSAVRGNRKGALRRFPREAVMAFFEARPERIFQQFCVNLFRVYIEVLNQRNRRIRELQNRLLHTSPAGGKRRFKLLVVDDEMGIRKALEELFKDGYDVTTALNGAEAIEQAFAKKPDLILLDLRLPDIDGFQVCERLKRHPDTAHIPIVMVTALATTPDKVKGIMYGADEYVIKPVDLKHLRDIVSRILGKAHG